MCKRLHAQSFSVWGQVIHYSLFPDGADLLVELSKKNIDFLFF